VFLRAALLEARPLQLHDLARPPARHGPSQPLGFAGRVARRRHRDVQHLVLEDDDPERFLQDRLEAAVRVRDVHGLAPYRALPCLHERMEGAGHDRAGPDKGHLDSQVLHGARLSHAQARHLGPRLDLKQADRVRLADTVEDDLVVVRDTAQVRGAAAALFDQLEAVLNERQHAQSEQIDLDHPGAVDAVLVPLNDVTTRPSRRLDRHGVLERVLGQHDAAYVLSDVAGEAHQLGRQLYEVPPYWRIDAGGELRCVLHLFGNAIGAPQ